MLALTFGEQIADQVMDLTRVKGSGIKISSAEMVQSLWNQKKYDLLLIKLFDRAHNILTIDVKRPDKIKKTIDETLKYFMVLSEVMEWSKLGEFLYNKCYDANAQLCVIENNGLKLQDYSYLPNSLRSSFLK